jgi:hypothetical protein
VTDERVKRQANGAFRFACHCLCGGSMSGSVDRETAAHDLVAMFDQRHDGDGHGPATATQAAAARRRLREKGF